MDAPAPAIDQWSFTAPFEGVIPHLYLDTRGNVTCGVGFLVPGLPELQRLPWSPSVAAALADYQHVRAAVPGAPAGAYAHLCVARLPASAMQQMFRDRVYGLRRALADWHLELLPMPAQVALVDMAYNLGAGGLNAFTHLRAACAARDWSSAAAQCHRIGVSDARNAATAAQFTACA